MTMTYTEVKAAWFNESFDLVLATQAQINKLRAELDDEWVGLRYEDFQEEMRGLRAESE